MFGGNRRRRAASNPPLNGPNVSASATTAASQAFLRSQASNASLAASAAGAALRSRPTTPISVADVQTKRTMKRAGSVSSMGSSGSGTQRGPPASQLVRRGSSGSMTERSFRDPSPNRSSAPVPSAVNAPPVPAIPQSLRNGQTKSQRRATSMEAPAMRVASPPPNKANGRGSSLQPARSSPNTRRNNQRSSGLSNVQELTGVERPASRGSVNFSLPTSARPMSPAGQKRLTSPSPSRQNNARIVSPTNHNLVYDPNTRSFLPESELLAIEQRIQDASNRQVKQKKRAPVAAGSHLTEGTAGGRPRGTAVDAMEAAAAKPAATKPASPIELPAAVPAPIIQEAPARKKKKVVLSDMESDQESYVPNSSDNDSDATPSKKFNTRAGQLLAKKPSVVRENREEEERQDDTPVKSPQNTNLMAAASPASDRQVSPSPLPRSVAGRGHGRGQASSSAAYAQERQQARSASQPPPDADFIIDGSNGLAAKPSSRGSRVQSVSPARTHFANSPENLTVRHNPPARSISPRKSALKPSSIPRGLSPSDGGNYQESEASAASEELSFPKKRGNRVSFDESHVVVGQSASPVVTESPVVLSPQNKRSWYSIGRSKKKEVSTTDDDEVMQPRPALPSFGSVRERKPSREFAEERQLVKPSEGGIGAPLETILSLPSPSLFTSQTGEILENPLGQSNDHIIGALVSQDANFKNEANTSKSREPSPPTVTSVEGNGYHSDSEGSLYDDNKTDSGLNRANSVKRGPDGANAETYQALASPIQELDTPVEEKSEHTANGNVPKIAVLAATPTLENEIREWPDMHSKSDMPGGWGSSTDDSSFQDTDESRHAVVDTTPAVVGIAEPPLPPASTAVPATQTPITKPSPLSIPEDYEESDTSIYSDAAEELSDTEGFISLNAVADSPVMKAPVSAFGISTPDSPKTKMTKERAYQKSQLSRNDSEPDINAGWDKVQSYWSTLSADRKRQLELEARQEDESGSETETEAKPQPKAQKIVALPSPALKKPALKKHVDPSPTQTPQRPREVRINSDRQYMIQPGVKAGPNGHAAPMKSSMRSERSEPINNSGDTHIRKSMRGNDTARHSLRADAPEPRGSLQKKYRPMSLPNEIKADPAEVQKHVKALSIASAKLAPSAAQKEMSRPAPGLRRTSSGNSDSSFKKEKRARASSDVPRFRGSMRGSSEQEMRGQSPARSSRFSLRTLSPTGSEMRRPFGGANGATPSGGSHMRSSMRNSMDTPSLRSAPVPSLRSAPRMGGKGFGNKPAKSKGTTTPKSSRFADSSDEEDARPAFRSRYDSSDDDEPTSMAAMPKTMRSAAPARQTPSRRYSSDISDDEDQSPVSSGLRLMKKPPQNGTAATNQGSTLATGSLRRSGSGRDTIQTGSVPASVNATPTRPQHTRRGSIMSILRRKKPVENGGDRVQKVGGESAARRDTPLERSSSDLAAVRSDRPATPKLQKRNSSNNGKQWPLKVPDSPPKIVGGEDGRPFTAEGDEPGTTRPDLGKRRFTAEPKKKKKFGALRRMFKLDD